MLLVLVLVRALHLDSHFDVSFERSVWLAIQSVALMQRAPIYLIQTYLLPCLEQNIDNSLFVIITYLYCDLCIQNTWQYKNEKCVSVPLDLFPLR